jgi:four helix bundle protein
MVASCWLQVKGDVMKSYRDLEIYQKAFRLAILVHQMSLTLPKYEMYEQGSQVRRSSKSIKDNIAEGYGRRRYKAEFVRYLIFALASCDETMSQLEMINSLHFQQNPIGELIIEYENLGKQINSFIQYIELNWRT